MEVPALPRNDRRGARPVALMNPVIHFVDLESIPTSPALSIRSGQMRASYSLRLIKHSSHYLQSQTARDQDQYRVNSGMGWVEGWVSTRNRSALSSPATVGQLLKLNYVYLMFWFTHKLATSECRRRFEPRPAPLREHDACHRARGAKSHKERTICRGGTGGRGCANLFITRQIARCTRRRTLHQYTHIS